MCGICGKHSPRGVMPEELRRMADAIAHRGPDDEGYHAAGPIGLACRRLSIIDLAGGHQPLGNEDGTIWIVLNGEIYNYLELRRDLERSGHRFATASDTEVIVHLYEEHGERCVERLRGMFAFAIWDERHEKLLLARDRLGQKPLFYAQRNDELLFGSEIKALLAVDGSLGQLNVESLHDFLSLRFIPAPGTMFRGVEKLPAGHLLVLQEGKARIERYWDLSFGRKLGGSEEQLLEALRERLAEAVETHLVSDVEVGALLSGGLDSSLIVSLMAKKMPEMLRTFSIGVEQQSFDELPHARMVAEHCGTRHTEETVSASIISNLPRLTWQMDEPSDPIAACMFHAAELASRFVKVTLGGDGGDELFAGFDRYRAVRSLAGVGRPLTILQRAILGPLSRRLPESFAYKSWTQRLRWLEAVARESESAERYAAATTFFRFSHAAKGELFTGPVWRRLVDRRSEDLLVELWAEQPEADPLDRMLYVDYRTRLPEHSLALTDRMSMAHGLEVRAPLVDHELVELAAAVPASLKLKRGTLKYLQRRLAEAELPRAIVRRPKQGFMFPVAYWFRDRLQGLLRSTLLDAAALGAEVFNGDYIRKLLDEHRAGQADHHVRLWMLLSIEIWHRIYIGGAEPAAIGLEIEDTLREDRP